MSGCTNKPDPLAPCSPGLPSKLEVRSGDGALRLALKPSPRTSQALDLCEGSQRTGSLTVGGSAITAADARGGLILALVDDGPDDASGTSPKGPALRVHREHGETRVLRPDGVPFGSVSVQAEEVRVFDKASVPIATVEPRDHDQVLRAPDGATRLYVVPSADAAAAGLFGVPDLGLTEQVALYYWASRPGR